MSNDQALVQVNIKSGEGYDATLVNVYAKTPDELVQLLEAVKTHAPLIAEAKGAVSFAHGIEVKKGSVNTTVQNDAPTAAVDAWTRDKVSGPGQPQEQPAPSFAQPNNQGPACAHGPMTFRQAKPGSGKDWKGYFCPTPQGTPNQCKPQFVK